MTRFDLYVQNWQNCTRCDYSKRRRRVVLGKGILPCDILVVGEAPGDSEDVAGVPMVAQAGRLMDRMLVKAGVVTPNTQGFIWGEGNTPAATWRYTVSVTNLLGCIPRDETRTKEPTPDHDCVMTCKPRLEEWIEFANPRLIVTAGKPCEEWFDQMWRDGIKTTVPIVHVMHPAGILRKSFVERGEVFKREVVRIKLAIRDHLMTEEERNAATPQKSKSRIGSNPSDNSSSGS